MARGSLPLALFGLLASTGVASGAPDSVKDVVEGDDVVLQCRFSPALADSSATLYWIRNINDQHDNVAIGETPFSTGYTVQHEPALGRYDLRIRNASYERDNGDFECRKVEFGTGRKLHSSMIQLVVLLPPSQPTVSPVLPTVTEGKAFNLSCSSIGGSPPPEILWYKDGSAEVEEGSVFKAGRTRTEASSALLTVIPKKEDDNSTYRCTVWNRAITSDRIMEASTSINVDYYPRVTVGPENPIRVERDETAELYCEVDSKPSVQEVRWVRDGRFVQTQFRHLIPRANLKDAGPYICSADNGLGQVGKAEVELDVQYGPEVTVPGQREVAHGEEVVVNCQVSANPSDVVIMWTKEGDASFRQTGQTLRLAGSNAAAENNGRYTCSATNHIQPTGKSRMERSGNATIAIAVRHAPGAAYIRCPQCGTPEHPEAREGKPVTLECGAKPPGHPLPTYRWWKAGSESTVLATGAKFTIDMARLSSAGSYFCQPSNDLGQGSVAETELEVLQEPKIISQLLPHIIKRAGDTGYQVTCSAVGKPKPSVRWFKDGVEIDGETSNLYQVSQTEQETRSNEAFTVLSILKFVGPDRIHKDQQYQLMPTDRGHYTCQFENSVDRTESTMLLRIEHQPVVRHRHNKVAADLGESATISCKMQAYPSLKFEWFKKGSLLTERNLYSMNTTELKDDIYEGLLNIAYVEDNSYGEYSCKALNSQGAKRTIIALVKKGKPERPENVRAVAKGYDMITLAWDKGFNGGYEETTYNVEYREVNGGKTKYADCRWTNHCNITGLEQYTTYVFKVKAVNIRGESSWSRDIKITTAVDVSMIPKPEHVYYETSSDTVSFNVVKYSLPLVAKIELQNEDNSWSFHEGLRMNDLPYGQRQIAGAMNGMRIQVCLENDEALCGPYTEAKQVEIAPTGRYTSDSVPKTVLIAIGIIVAVVAIAATVLIVRFYCCVPAKPKKLTKEDIAGPARANQGHNNFNYGLDNKGVDTAKDADSPDLIKSQMYGYNAYPAMPAAQVPNNLYGQDSTSNSNNGGSVNSQDSLWNVKHPNGEPIGANGYIAAGYYGDPQHQQMHQQHHQQQQQYQQQQQQSYNPQQQMEDYTHYPHPEEYMSERNRAAYFANGDQYAMPSKPRQRLESDYSPYGDVSGLPDPYTGHDISDELRQQSLDMHGLEHDLSAAAPEGYTTPNRRVIREIIV